MAKAGRTHMGVGSQGKGSGSGAGTEIDKDAIGENMVLSNRDKARHPTDRGVDNKAIESEQYQDHDGDRLTKD